MRRSQGTVIGFCLALVALHFVSSPAGSQEVPQNNIAVGVAGLAGEEQLSELRFDVNVSEAASMLIDGEHSVGLVVYMTDGTTFFVGFDTFDGQSSATAIARYQLPQVFTASSSSVGAGGDRARNFDARERRVAVPFEWDADTTYTFTIGRSDIGDEMELAFAVSGGGTSVEIGSHFVPAGVSGRADAAVSIAQQINLSSGCIAASQFEVAVDSGVSVTPGGEEPIEFDRGYATEDSCSSSGAITIAPGSVNLTLSTGGNFLSGPLGTGLPIDGNYISGDAIDPDFPYCLANIDPEGQRRVCFDNSEDREDHINAIINSDERPEGETIWIGRFDEEVVAP